jgi:hypothetical protein
VIDFDFITACLATGNAIESPDDVEQLALAGITHVIDCTWDEADQYYLGADPRISCLWNPTEDDGQAKDPMWFMHSVEYYFMAAAKPHTKVYTHCTNGKNRGPSTAFAILFAFGIDYDLAIDMIHKARPITLNGLKYVNDAANGLQYLGYPA